jgi:hypothetical protein
MRIGFLFNHDQIHQVAHSLPIALELANLAPQLEIVIATTNERLHNEVTRIAAARHAAANIRFIDLRPRSGLIRAAAAVLNPILPAAKLTIYRDNLDYFRSLDALVVAEKTSAILKTRYGLAGLKLIHTRHGAGDRAIGFNKASRNFDHVLVSGPKVRDRLIGEAGIPPERLSMVGYPKFDLVSRRPAPLPIQANGRPTILYNPHVSPHLSSWYKDGRKVLDYFLANPAYNLIFAPHVMLFERPLVVTIDKLQINRPGRIAKRFWNAPNIHIDLGSRASTDMSYTMAADLYLGDVSSQVYEFLLRRRPCIFLNSHNVDYQGDANYAHWQTGRVIRSADELDSALSQAWTSHPDYLPAQSQLFERSFDLTNRPSSLRAAKAILGFLNGLSKSRSSRTDAAGLIAA